MPLSKASAEAKDAAAAYSGPAVDIAKDAITRATKAALFCRPCTVQSDEGKGEIEEKAAGGGGGGAGGGGKAGLGGEDGLLASIIAAATVATS